MSRWIDIIHVATPGFGLMPRQHRLAIVDEVAARHGFTREQIMGRSRNAEIVLARWDAMRAVQRKFGDSYAQIGRLFGRDHTSVMHAMAQLQAAEKEPAA